MPEHLSGRYAVAEQKVLGSVQKRMKLGGLSYPEPTALMVSSDFQNLQVCSEPGIMKSQRVNPFKIASKCQEIHFKHTKTDSLTVVAQ